MSTGKTNLTSTQFSAKKLLGKAHTSNLKGDVNEAIPSSVSIVSDGVFAEAIPNTPTDQMYVRSGDGGGAPLTVEKVFLDVVSLSDTIYDANVSGGGGDEASTSGPHGYYLKLPSKSRPFWLRVLIASPSALTTSPLSVEPERSTAKDIAEPPL